MKAIYKDKQKGAVAPMVGILMVVFMLCVAVVVDLGHLHNVKVQLQRAADAAALGGAPHLDGGSNQDSNAIAVARATAAANKVAGKTGLVADGGWVDGTSVVVTLGTWDPDRTITPVDARFSSPVAANTADAIKVTATLAVEHYFFFYADNTTIVADAVAVNSFEETAMPIALLSCVPFNAGISDTVCDIEMYKFSVDPKDTAGWTALTYDINAAQLKYFFTPEGNAVLNQVIYGTGLDHQGLENEPVMKSDSSYNSTIPCGDKNVELDIKCGLGPEFETDPTPDDPLDYVLNANDPLPRWDDAAFNRIWSMDGILQQGYVVGEDATAYEARLFALRAASDSGVWTNYETSYPVPTLPTWAKDGRFATHTEIIDEHKGETIAFFDRALHYAGYPMVEAKNGEDNAVIQEFIDLSTDGDHFKDSLTNINVPFDATASDDPHNSYGGGETFAVTIPVIFAGKCSSDEEEGWKALKGKYYIGTANLLITRLWKGKNECYDAVNPLTIYGSPPCSIADFSPVLAGNEFACVTGAGSGAAAGFEALITPKGEEGPRGKHKIYLVE